MVGTNLIVDIRSIIFTNMISTAKGGDGVYHSYSAPLVMITRHDH